MRRVMIVIFSIICAAIFAVQVHDMANPEEVICQTKQIVATYGDNLWKLEKQASCTGGFDRQDRISQILLLNNMSSARALQHGQIVVFP